MSAEGARLPLDAPRPLAERWRAAWPEALEVWSKFTRLRPPILCLTEYKARQEGLADSFAMIRLADQTIVVSLPGVLLAGLSDYPWEILAHEIGHHILAPATLTDHARLIARVRWALPTVEQFTPLTANLYTDLLVNDRLQRDASLRLAEVYRLLRPGAGENRGRVWAVYLRIYELLWSLPKGSLGGGPTDDHMDGDAWLGMRLLRSYAREWLEGAGRFAALLLPYLLEDAESGRFPTEWHDTRDAGDGGEPAGLVEEDPGERDGAVHPAADPSLNGEEADEKKECAKRSDQPRVAAPAPRASGGQCREPFQYGEILRAAGLRLNDHEMAVRYYRERAGRHLIPFPSRPSPRGADPLPEGLEPWDIGQPLDGVDWLQSVLVSPVVIPGQTTVQRVWGTTEGERPQREPLDLDLYVDSSGSIPNPQVLTSYLALAGAVVCLSALRAGARVQATLWSGTRQFTTTRGFVRDEQAVLGVLTGYFGGATAFPVHVLRDTYAGRKPDSRPVHIMVISDDGVTTMFDRDEKGRSGWEISAESLRKARGGGTFVLNLPQGWETAGDDGSDFGKLRRAREEQGWAVFRVASWEELEAFARQFSRTHWGEDKPAPAKR